MRAVVSRQYASQPRRARAQGAGRGLGSQGNARAPAEKVRGPRKGKPQARRAHGGPYGAHAPIRVGGGRETHRYERELPASRASRRTRKVAAVCLSVTAEWRPSKQAASARAQLSILTRGNGGCQTRLARARPPPRPRPSHRTRQGVSRGTRQRVTGVSRLSPGARGPSTPSSAFAPLRLRASNLLCLGGVACEPWRGAAPRWRSRRPGGRLSWARRRRRTRRRCRITRLRPAPPGCARAAGWRPRPRSLWSGRSRPPRRPRRLQGAWRGCWTWGRRLRPRRRPRPHQVRQLGRTLALGLGGLALGLGHHSRASERVAHARPAEVAPRTLSRSDTAPALRSVSPLHASPSVMPSALAARLAVETQQRQQHARLPTAQPPYPSASASAAFSANSWSDVLAGLESTNERLSAATAAGRDFPPPQSAEFGRPWVPDVQVAASGGAESGAVSAGQALPAGLLGGGAERGALSGEVAAPRASVESLVSRQAPRERGVPMTVAPVAPAAVASPPRAGVSASFVQTEAAPPAAPAAVQAPTSNALAAVSKALQGSSAGIDRARALAALAALKRAVEELEAALGADSGADGAGQVGKETVASVPLDEKSHLAAAGAAAGAAPAPVEAPDATHTKAAGAGAALAAALATLPKAPSAQPSPELPQLPAALQARLEATRQLPVAANGRE